LINCDIHGVLTRFTDVEGVRVIIGGGDGSTTSVVEEISKIDFKHMPVGAALLPLGTGNELSRVFGWGKAFELHGSGVDSVAEYLQSVDEAELQPLDQWRVEVHGEGKERDGKGNQSRSDLAAPRSLHTMNCFFSIGLDAYVTHSFHQLREAHPDFCNTRGTNKVAYALYGIKSFFACHGIYDQMHVTLDGAPVPISRFAEGLTMLNIPSTADGTNPWAQPKWKEGKSGSSSAGQGPVQSVADGRLEVVEFSGALHLAGIQAGVTGGDRVGQAGIIQITLDRDFPAQVDGEPVTLQKGDRVTVEPLRQVWMLQAPAWYKPG
tara:strand:+ start:286 stop:1248 length:963 start_codon:yes stop_codon:yes gene_type:complete